MKFDELAWVEFLQKVVPLNKNVKVGIGDDCAVVNFRKPQVVLKSDLFIEGVHFPSFKLKRIKNIDFKVIGMRAVGRVLSDFAAIGAKPDCIGISLGMPKYISLNNLKNILSGILEYSKKYTFSFVGGDTSRAAHLFLDVWGVGSLIKKEILRKNAKTGDYIFLTGMLGKTDFSAPIIPRLKESKYLINNFKINAMIDISDGFFLDLGRILQASGQGALVDRERIPCFCGNADLSRGEDYELIFTVDKNEPLIEKLKERFFLVGRITEKRDGYKLKNKNKIKDIKLKGYLHQ